MGSLLFALVSSVVAWALIRNLPGSAGSAGALKRLNLRQGASYAITTILNYVIIIVGAMTVFGSLGVSWDKLQWLAAALSVGLGFGLQEIFGNFCLWPDYPVRNVRCVSAIPSPSVLSPGPSARSAFVRPPLPTSISKEVIIPIKAFGDRASDQLVALRIPPLAW